ncbi:MAG: 3',5'-cyclic-nucleotide phosphodiesterase [Acidobacteriota bacterium]
MKFQLLPSTFDENGRASAKQHLACIIIDDQVAIDAGSLAMACSDVQRANVRDILLTHAHLDHVAGLPLFIDDLYSTLTEPLRIHAATEVIEVLERDIFNWSVYPRFSELKNANGQVIEYHPFAIGSEFTVLHLKVRSAAVNHQVPSAGFIVSDLKTTVAISGDTSEMDEFWMAANAQQGLAVLLIECAMPNEMQDLADMSHHLTPNALASELEKFKCKNCPVFIINIKPSYRESVIAQIGELGLENVEIMEVGRVYDW